MILTLEHGDAARVPAGTDREIPLPNGSRVRVAAGPTDYVFDDARFAVFVDTTWDASHREALARLIGAFLVRCADGTVDALDEVLPVPHFLVAVDTQAGGIHVVRDRSGVKTGYYGAGAAGLVVGTMMHEVAARCGATAFDPRTVWQLLLTGFTSDGGTFYEGIHEVCTGAQLVFGRDGALRRQRIVGLPVDDAENPFPYERNVQLLRTHINEAHAKLASARDNVVLLSGGIDSAVMLAALAERPATALSLRVAGTQQDESPYARATAAFLHREIRVVDLDPEREITPVEFEQTVLRMNNPYMGVWLFGGLDGAADRTYFGGQDTRLHTPSINAVDRLLFAIGFWRAHLPARVWRLAAGCLFPLAAALRLDTSRSRRMRGWYRLLASCRPAEFLKHYHLHYEGSPTIRAAMSAEQWAAVAPGLDPGWDPAQLERLATPRQLYNHLVMRNWLTQYTDDMRYMQDLARMNGTYMAMPFYDPDLTRFSSGIPFDQASRLRMGRARYGAARTIINKCLLRDAYRADLCDEVYYRDKATSDQFILLFRGGLGRALKAVLASDLERGVSFIRAHRLEPYVQRLFADDPAVYRDHLYMVTLHYLAALCTYQKAVLAAAAPAPAAPGHGRS